MKIDFSSKCGEVLRNGYGMYLFRCGYCDGAFAFSTDILEHIECHFQSCQQPDNLNFFNEIVTDLKIERCDGVSVENGNTFQECEVTDDPLSLNVENGRPSFGDNISNVSVTNPTIDAAVHVCDICNRRVLGAIALTRHLQAHITSYSCTECDSVFFTANRLNDHKKCHENVKQNRNTNRLEGLNENETNVSLVSSVEFANHLNSSDLVPRNTIETKIQENCVPIKEKLNRCKFASGTKDSFENQPENCTIASIEEEMSENRSFQCDICQKFVTGKLNLLTHFEQHQHQYRHLQFPCPKCDKVFRSAFELKKHMQFHETGETYTCNECGKVYHYNIAYVRHLTTHKAHKYFCTECTRSFILQQSLRVHMRKQHGIFSKLVHHCPICERPFGKMSSMKIHILTHSNERSIVCEICGQQLRDLMSLKIHMRKHSNQTTTTNIVQVSQAKEKRYKCKYCNKELKHRSSILTHIRMHTGEKPYKCLSCDMAFGSTSALQLHKKRHLITPRDIKCRLCGKFYPNNDRLKQHKIDEHKDLKYYDCDICKMRFFKNWCFKKHRETHSDKRLYKCRYCDRDFRQNSGRLRHEKKKHL